MKVFVRRYVFDLLWVCKCWMTVWWFSCYGPLVLNAELDYLNPPPKCCYSLANQFNYEILPVQIFSKRCEHCRSDKSPLCSHHHWTDTRERERCIHPQKKKNKGSKKKLQSWSHHNLNNFVLNPFAKFLHPSQYLLGYINSSDTDTETSRNRCLLVIRYTWTSHNPCEIQILYPAHFDGSLRKDLRRKGHT